MRGGSGKQGMGSADRLQSSLDDKPFAHPYFWAGFIYTGY